MRFTVAAASLAAVLALSGCKDEPKTEAEVKAEVAQMPKPKPGLYRSTSKLLDFVMPGVPAAQQEQFRQVFSQQSAKDFCLTKEEAAKGYEEMTKKLAEGNCKNERFNATSSTLDAKFSCVVGQGMNASIAMKGDISEEGSKMTMEIQQSSAQMPDKSIKIVAEVTSARVGDCPGS